MRERLKLLDNLHEKQKPLWGKMTPQQMVEHLYKTVQLSINEIELNVYTEESKIPVLKRLFLGERSLPKEFMNPAIGPDLLPLEFHDLNSAIDEFEKVITRYDKFFTENPLIKTTHPVFGELTKEEWDIFHKKHFQHHMSQFGLGE
ncbi:MAG: DUF1569 domain-containing protein [Ignavibacteriaceae bacterium]